MRLYALLILLILPWSAPAQPEDSVLQAADSTMFFNESSETYSDRPDDKAQPDSASISVRSFSPDAIDRLKADPDLQYTSEPTVVETLWDRFLRWLMSLLNSMADTATSTNWGRVMTYVGVLAILIVIVMMLLKVNAFNIFKGNEAAQVPHHVLDENIHEMNFDTLIQEALSGKDYRLAVRLLFLYALKMLSDGNYVHWAQGKTNHDYINELKGGDIKTGFSELNYFFEKAWYGNFAITDMMYARVRSTFDSWRRKV